MGAAVDVLETSDALSSTPFSKILHIHVTQKSNTALLVHESTPVRNVRVHAIK